jgi:transposase
LVPTNFPPWELVYQQTQRWLQAGCFEAMVSDLRSMVRVAQGRQGQPSAVIDQGYTGEEPAQAAQDEGIELQVIKLSEAKRGFVLLPRRWVVERSFGWLNRFRRLARDYERLPETLAGLHFVVFAMLMLAHAVPTLHSS